MFDKIKDMIRDIFCMHDYRFQGTWDFRYEACTRCGKVKGMR